MAAPKWRAAHPQGDPGKLIGVRLTTTLVGALDTLSAEWDMPRAAVVEKLLRNAIAAVTLGRRVRSRMESK